jgi:hypothetical protein
MPLFQHITFREIEQYMARLSQPRGAWDPKLALEQGMQQDEVKQSDGVGTVHRAPEVK